ncbi:hypothetical protein ACFVWN_15915 [Nocardiopsis flavescens]|uniref:Uncharacterized protein n=1 Tax=Nocardiopsis flavescens TaxID=758803 RepID=A0A1M6FKU2_9ACTN|nr:hypothetical protein [Nocardiopsis flavescens]SHI98331.1 hypothetical protein SAMN05421803_10369 [Nocardiopsis flavescens]
MMILELLDRTNENDTENRERQGVRLTARQMRARQREQRRAEDALMEIAWSRLC